MDKNANTDGRSPEHYQSQGGGEQLWDEEWRISREITFVFNIVKYVRRYRKKDGLKDLRKARHYLDKLIELEQRDAHDNPPCPSPVVDEAPKNGDLVHLMGLVVGQSACQFEEAKMVPSSDCFKVTCPECRRLIK